MVHSESLFPLVFFARFSPFYNLIRLFNCAFIPSPSVDMNRWASIGPLKERKSCFFFPPDIHQIILFPFIWGASEWANHFFSYGLSSHSHQFIHATEPKMFSVRVAFVHNITPFFPMLLFVSPIIGVRTSVIRNDVPSVKSSLWCTS